MITKEQALNLVNECEAFKKERAQKEANDFVERVVSPAIAAKAKNGGRLLDDTIIPTGIDSSLVCNILKQNGFSVSPCGNVRDITISW